MADVPTTSTTLLRDLAQDSQHVRWGEFVARYRPMMEAFMRERFPSLDADDVIQETLVAVCKVMPSYRYDPDVKGHFRSYLTGILRHRALRMLREESRRAKLVADTQRDGSPLSAEHDDEAWRATVFEMALARFLADPSVADRTKRIFERTAIGGEPPEAVAAAFQMTRHAVDQAKSRALSRLRELVRELESVAGE
ncbi:MAG: sigma-70 family RNA polymerase sigma factor [Kiritimatiellae bacterium]|nr:sigma-70 family RNA polymerase sigma factor [Kiritimatiellia bacterium]